MTSATRIMLLLAVFLTLSACEIQIDPATGQVVLITPNGSKTCIGQVCKETFIFDARAVLQPIPPLGFIFDGWSLCLQTDNSACVLDYDGTIVQKFWGQSFAVNAGFRPRVATEIHGFYEGSATFRGASYNIGCLVDYQNAAHCYGSGAADPSKKIAMAFPNLTPNGSGFDDLRGSFVLGSVGETVHLLNQTMSAGIGMGVNFRADSDNANGSFSVAINANYAIGLALNLTEGDYAFVADKNGPASGSVSIQAGGGITVSQNGCTETGTMRVTPNTQYTSTYPLALTGNCGTLGASGIGTAVVLSTEENADEQLLLLERKQDLPVSRPSHILLKRSHRL